MSAVVRRFEKSLTLIIYSVSPALFKSHLAMAEDIEFVPSSGLVQLPRISRWTTGRDATALRKKSNAWKRTS